MTKNNNKFECCNETRKHASNNKFPVSKWALIDLICLLTTLGLLTALGLKPLGCQEPLGGQKAKSVNKVLLY